jgi:hypothetical protein
MPEDVLTAMLKQLARQRRSDDEKRRLVTVSQFKEARPSVQRRLDSLKDRESALGARDYLLELSGIAFDLFELGGCRSASALLVHRYRKDLQELEVEERMRIGLILLEWKVKDRDDFEACQLLAKLGPTFDELPRTDERKWQYTKLRIQALNIACAYTDAKSAISEALEWAPDDERACLRADLAEMELLQGDFDQDEV